MTNYFNVGAFFVLFRESVEAAIILAILLRYVDRTVVDVIHRKTLRRQVWGGTLAGVLLSLIIGIALTVIFYVLGKDVFGEAEPLWEGILMTLAVVLLTWLALRMLRINVLIANWESKIKKLTSEAEVAKKVDEVLALDESASSSSGISRFWAWTTKYSLAILAFTVVVREGFEAVIFIAGVIPIYDFGRSTLIQRCIENQVGQAEPIALIIPSTLGLAAGLLVGWLLYRGSASLNLNLFFSISCGILLVIAAGLCAGAAHEFEEYHYAHVVAPMYPAGEEAPESTPVLWDLSECCSQKTHWFFQILNALVGWRAIATVATVTAYFTYWAVIAILFAGYYIYGKRHPEPFEDVEAKKVVEMDSGNVLEPSLDGYGE